MTKMTINQQNVNKLLQVGIQNCQTLLKFPNRQRNSPKSENPNRIVKFPLQKVSISTPWAPPYPPRALPRAPAPQKITVAIVANSSHFKTFFWSCWYDLVFVPASDLGVHSKICPHVRSMCLVLASFAAVRTEVLLQPFAITFFCHDAIDRRPLVLGLVQRDAFVVVEFFEFVLRSASLRQTSPERWGSQFGQRHYGGRPRRPDHALSSPR